MNHIKIGGLMKIYLVLILCMGYLLSGCSSIYTLDDSGTKDRFSKDCASSISGKQITVTLTNDSSFKTRRAILQSDTLLVFSGYQGKKENETMPTENIQDIEYTTTAYSQEDSSRSADVTLKSGDKLSLENIRFLPGNSKVISFTESKIPAENIKYISYKSHTIPAIEGALLGSAAGVLTIWINSKRDPSKKPYFDSFDTPLPIPVGMIIGGIAGWFIGNNSVYQFH
jgi:hypothetical protein